MVGMDIPWFIGGVVLVERVFDWPGLKWTPGIAAGLGTTWVPTLVTRASQCHFGASVGILFGGFARSAAVIATATRCRATWRSPRRISTGVACPTMLPVRLPSSSFRSTRRISVLMLRPKALKDCVRPVADSAARAICCADVRAESESRFSANNAIA